MRGIEVLQWIGLGLGVLLVLSMAAGAILGQPVGLSYVETGSMEPTLQAGDGFIAVPTALAGPVEEGDVVVFDAVELHDGGLVTHRVVDETDQGYITRGDANPVTDQDGDEPPVQESQIKAKALQVGGNVVPIPRLGVVIIGASEGIERVQHTLAGLLGTRALLGTQGLAFLLIGVGIVTYVLASLVERGRKQERTRRTKRSTGAVTPGMVIAVMTVFLVLSLTLSMTVPGGQHDFQFVSSETDSDSPSVIQRGSTENLTYNVPSNGPFPVVTVVDPVSDGIDVSPSHVYVSGGSVENVTVTIQAPPDTGSYTESIHEHRYLAVLPTGVILSLYAVHPWAPIVAINVVVGTLFVGLALLLLGLDPIRINRRENPIPLRIRLRRWLR